MAESTSPRPNPPARWTRWLLWAAVALALTAVFASYLQPGLMVDLANRLWSCF